LCINCTQLINVLIVKAINIAGIQIQSQKTELTFTISIFMQIQLIHSINISAWDNVVADEERLWSKLGPSKSMRPYWKSKLKAKGLGPSLK
jgi:hypothetical protein